MIQLNHRDPRPLYEQIKDSLRKLLVTGAIAPSEKLPSVRELATTLAMNPNTIQRAYRELESEGYIYTVSGKGSFACPREYVEDVYRDHLFASFDKLVLELLALGETTETLKTHIASLQRKENNADDSSN